MGRYIIRLNQPNFLSCKKINTSFIFDIRNLHLCRSRFKKTYMENATKGQRSQLKLHHFSNQYPPVNSIPTETNKRDRSRTIPYRIKNNYPSSTLSGRASAAAAVISDLSVAASFIHPIIDRRRNNEIFENDYQ